MTLGRIAFGDTEYPTNTWNNFFGSPVRYSLDRPDYLVKTTETEVVVQIEVPGFDADDIEVTVQGDRLRMDAVSDNKSLPHKHRNVVIGLAEYERGNPAKAKAMLKNGILTITMPRLVLDKDLYTIPVEVGA